MLPTGIVTFLFTDIQGSTSLWERDPAAMRHALALHNQIMVKAIADHAGTVFKFIGDAYQVAFDSPLQAVEAALQAQRGLAVTAWGEAEPLRVRMGIHSGPAEVSGDEYAVGHTLNRVARIMSAGHGGQILLSASAAELLKENLPPGLQLHDLGEHLLKGLSRPEQIFQVLSPDLPQDFPPLVTVAQPRHNLPSHLTSFIGRAKEIELIQRKFAAARLVTLTGTGGVGKTRLACQYAMQSLDRYPAGIWWVELAPISNPELIPQAVANALGLRSEGNQLPIDNLVTSLLGKKMLVIFDNCEHLVESCALLAARLLEACPDLKLLATSREVLGIDGEAVLRVPSLSAPERGSPGEVKSHLAPDQLLQFEAVQLFLERAQASQPEFVLNETTAPAVTLICERLDGIPLAIELAAARVAVLNVQQIADRLEDMFRLLTGGSRTTVPRHQTLRSAIHWSYELLEPVERLLFLHLSVFVGGFTLEAAEAVAAVPAGAGLTQAGSAPDRQREVALQPGELLDTLLRLVKKSLLVVDYRTDRPVRYHMLETIRQYAREMLLESGEVEVIHTRHRHWFVSWVTAGIPKQMNAELPGWMDEIEADIDNLRAALEWSYLEGTGQEYALLISSALFRYWWMRGNLAEGLQWLKQGLALEDDRPDLILPRARALYVASWISGELGDQEECLGNARSAVEYYRKAGEAGQPGLILALANLASILNNANQVEEERILLEEGEAIGRRLGQAGAWSLAMLLWNKSLIAYSHGDISLAQAVSEESWSLFLQTGDRWNAGPLMNLGLLAQSHKRYDVAQRYYEDALTLYSEVKDRGGMVFALNNLTFLAVILGKPQQAALYYREQFKIWQAQGNRTKIIEFIKIGCYFSIMEALKSPPEQALERFRLVLSALALAASQQPEGSGPLSEETLVIWYLENSRGWAVYNSLPFTNKERKSIQEKLKALFSALGQAGFQEALVQAKSLSLDQAVSQIYDFPL